MIVEPDIEQAPWEQQARSDAPLYLKQIEYLFERSRFYRDKLERAGFATHGAVGGLEAIEGAPLTEKDELRRSRSADEPIGSHRTASREEIVRIYSTSGTTGTPSYIPLTAADLEVWVRTSARSYAASGLTRGERIVSTYNAGPFVAGAALGAFDRLGLCHIPVGSGNTERLDRRGRAFEADRRRNDALLRPASCRMGGGARQGPCAVEREEGDGRGRAGRRGARDARQARSGMGRERHRGDGHRRHFRFPLGRVRAEGRHAFQRPGLRAFRADRSGDGRRHSACRRRRRRARAHSSRQSLGAAPALSHPRPCALEHGQMRLRAHEPARALHRPHRRHADRARRQRLSLRLARGGQRVRARGRRRDRDPPACRWRQAGAAAAGQRRARAGEAPEGLADRIRARLRDKLLVTTEITLVAPGALPRSEYKSKLVEKV